MTRPAIPFAKGHGTGNDFVILTDLDAQLELSGDEVRRLCNRRHGIGADGVLVVTRTAATREVTDQSDAEFFMDYRNADGSIAEMCGNGSRVFVRFLIEEGLTAPGEVPIATRGGIRLARTLEDGSIRVEMGEATLLDEDITVATVPEEGPKRPAIGVLMPNPHAVCWVEDVAEAGALAEPPLVAPAETFPDGVNVEFVAELDDGHVKMRVHERGVGETESCGTGACAAAVATLARRGEGPAGQEIEVEVPGGRLQVAWREDGCVDLSGPAVIVARGILTADWWSTA